MSGVIGNRFADNLESVVGLFIPAGMGTEERLFIYLGGSLRLASLRLILTVLSLYWRILLLLSAILRVRRSLRRAGLMCLRMFGEVLLWFSLKVRRCSGRVFRCRLRFCRIVLVRLLVKWEWLMLILRSRLRVRLVDVVYLAATVSRTLIPVVWWLG